MCRISVLEVVDAVFELVEHPFVPVQLDVTPYAKVPID